MNSEFPPARPHGDIRRLFEDVFIVTGTARMVAPIPMTFSRNMAIIREDGVLTLVNSVRLDGSGLAELDALGEVKHVIRLAGFHGTDDAFYKDRYDATVWAIAGQKYTRGMDTDPSPDDIYFKADEEIIGDSILPLSNATLYQFHTATPPEGLLMLEREGGIIISGDCLQNWCRPDRYFSFLAKPMMRMMGFIKPYNIGPGWLRFAKPDPQEILGILDLPFEHVLPAHGEEVLGDAKEHYRKTIDSLNQA